MILYIVIYKNQNYKKEEHTPTIVGKYNLIN